MTDEELTVLYNEANGITGKRLPITTQRIFTAMRAAAEVERKAAELRCLKKPVLLAGLHPYTALNVQQMMSDAVSMRSNAELWGAPPTGGASHTNAVLGAAVPPEPTFEGSTKDEH